MTPYQKNTVRALAWTVFLVCALPIGSVQAQSTDALRQDLERLRRDVTDLQRSVYRGESPQASPASPASGASGDVPASVASRLQVKQQQVEDDLRRMNGRIEELEFGLRQMTEKFDRFTADLDLRLRALETGTAPGSPDSAAGAAAGTSLDHPPASSTTVISSAGATGPGATPRGGSQGLAAGVQPLGAISEADLARNSQAPAARAQSGGQAASPAPAAAPNVAPPPAGAGPQEQYDYAIRLLFARDYAGAEKTLTDFLVKNPDNALAGNAYYWLGETHYVRNDFAKSATVFLDAYQKYPDGNKAPDSLLKLALSLGQVGETQAACAALSELGAKFPNAAVPIQRRAAQERQTRKCG